MLCFVPASSADEDPPKSLVVTNSASWVPYSFLDFQGNPKGLLIDVWRLFGDHNNVDVTFDLVDWQDSLDQIRSGAADVLGGLVDTEDREEYLRFSQGLMRVRTLLYVPAHSDVSNLSEIGKTPVGVVESTFQQSFIQSYFPDTVLQPFPNSERMVEAAVNGEVEAFVTDFPTGHYHLIAMDSLERFKADHVLFTENIRAAVDKDAEALLAFIDSGLLRISRYEMAEIRDRWFVPAEPIAKWIIAAVVVLAAVLLVGAFGVHYISLRRAVRKKTEALRRSVRKLRSANSRLDRLARVDPLTGIANRHQFYQSATIEIERAKRYGRPLSMTLFDLDHLKKVNDRYGHLAGDAILQRAADVVAANLRENDTFARIGGDEFVAILPETKVDEAILLAERILAIARERPFEFEGHEIELSFSAGVAEFNEENSIEQWICRADEELYRSKAEGRAQVSGDA